MDNYEFRRIYKINTLIFILGRKSGEGNDVGRPNALLRVQITGRWCKSCRWGRTPDRRGDPEVAELSCAVCYSVSYPLNVTPVHLLICQASSLIFTLPNCCFCFITSWSRRFRLSKATASNNNILASTFRRWKLKCWVSDGQKRTTTSSVCE